jgi:DNA invertase Pin-like site-specific DNA recombinase
MTYKQFRALVIESQADLKKKAEQLKKLSTKEIVLLAVGEMLQIQETMIEQWKQQAEKRSKDISEGMTAAAKKHGYKYGGARRKSKLNYKVIRALAKGGMKRAEIARQFGVTRARISQICKKEKP